MTISWLKLNTAVGISNRKEMDMESRPLYKDIILFWHLLKDIITDKNLDFGMKYITIRSCYRAIKRRREE